MNRTVGIVIVVLVVLGLAIYINAQRREPNEWQDGTYTGRSAPDTRGYYGEIELVIADGKITKAKYWELDREGKPKDESYPYPQALEAFPKYDQGLLKSQDPDKVDVVTGSTESHVRFKEAAKDALDKAARGESGRAPAPPAPAPSPTPAPPRPETTMQWRDGTYGAKTETDQYGYYGEIELMITNGKITKVTYDEKDSEGKPKGPDYPYPQGPESETKYEERLLQTQDPEKVEVITGATQTWEKFKQTAKEALKKAE